MLRFSYLLLFLGLGFTALQAQPNRYRQAIFSSSTKTANVNYTIAAPYSPNSNSSRPYDLDVYEPQGDTASKRPLVIAIYGGSFIAGSKEAPDIVAWCDSLARHGYVCAAHNYRLGFNALGGQGSLIRAGYRALQDTRAAIRFLKSEHQTYRIDTTVIFIVGNSAGAITAMQTAYASDSDRPQSSFGLPSGVGNDTADLGCLDCSGNHRERTVQVDGLVGLWGAVLDPAAIDTNDNSPALLIHGLDDQTVLPGIGPAFNTAGQPILYGSIAVDSLLRNAGIRSELHTYPSLGHNFYYNGTTFPNNYWDTLFPMGRDFFCSLNPYCLPAVNINRLASVDMGLELWPNPLRNGQSLNLKHNSNQTLEMSLIDVQGRIIKQERLFNQEWQSPLNDLSPGVYWIQLRDEQGGLQIKGFQKL